jgi:hypothetical protein
MAGMSPTHLNVRFRGKADIIKMNGAATQVASFEASLEQPAFF